MEFINQFHKHYDESRIWLKNTFMGISMYKLPFDAFVIAELIYKVKPWFIIETGTAKGGSASFYAAMMELMGCGMVYSIDINIDKCEIDGEFEWSDRVCLIQGDSTEQKVIDELEHQIALEFLPPNTSIDVFKHPIRGMVILDSWHTKSHVLKEMEIYKKYVGIGSYMIVEDTHVNGHPIKWEWGEGPYEAVQEYLECYDDFVVDWECEKHLMTFNPSGYLKKIK